MELSGWTLSLSVEIPEDASFAVITYDDNPHGFMFLGEPERKIINKKAKYDTNVPYVIAYHDRAHGWIKNDYQIMSAMFGEDRFVVGGPYAEGAVRGPGAELGSARKPKNTRVSAILQVPYVISFTLPGKGPRLWHNPWAKHPLPRDWWQGDQMIPVREAYSNRGQMTKLRGKSVAEILGLHTDFPNSAP